MPNTAATNMKHAFGTSELARWSPDPTRSLQAWDAADLYLLALLEEQQVKLENASVLLLNDEFGALTTALAGAGFPGLHVHCVDDSFVGRTAAARNLEENKVTCQHTIAPRLTQQDTDFDLVLLKIPKSSALLTDQLHTLRSHLHPASQVFAAAMDKHLSPNAQKSIERLVGPTERLLARKKARAFKVSPDFELDPGTNPHPARLKIESLPAPLLLHSAVFSQRKLDPGSAMLLKHLPAIEPQTDVIDLGCGAGVLGLHCLLKEPTARLLFIDESAAATESAKSNLASLFPESDSVCLNQDCLEPPPERPVGLIVCNPPFHANRNVLTATAERMFKQSHRVLASGGRLLIVGNRHLDYPTRLNRIFGQSTVLAQDNRYQVVSARRR